MAGTIGAALVRLRRDGFDDLLSTRRFEQLCREDGHIWRERLLSPALTLRLFLLQVVHGNVAINAMRQLSGIPFAAASYCQARARLPLAALQRMLVELSDAALTHVPRQEGQARVYAVDSFNLTLADTPALRQRFGLPQPVKVGVSYPMCMVIGLVDLACGLFIRAAAFAVFVHDQRGAVAVHEALGQGDILVGDRAFCSYGQMALLAARGVYCCLRLHQRRKVTRAGMVRWDKPRLCPRWMSLWQFETLPQQLTVRIVRHRIGRKGYRTRAVMIATTLLDQRQWSDQRIAELYRQRWQIETCFAHLKTTMKLNAPRCKSVDGVLKELTVYLIVYNLIRLIMLAWARTCDVCIWRISFIDALRLLCAKALGLSGTKRLILNPDRTGRRQLRVRRRRPRHYPLLTRPRARQPNTNNYRRR